MKTITYLLAVIFLTTLQTATLQASSSPHFNDGVEGSVSDGSDTEMDNADGEKSYYLLDLTARTHATLDILQGNNSHEWLKGCRDAIKIIQLPSDDNEALRRLQERLKFALTLFIDRFEPYVTGLTAVKEEDNPAIPGELAEAEKIQEILASAQEIMA